jgi:hypothetical protein
MPVLGIRVSKYYKSLGISDFKRTKLALYSQKVNFSPQTNPDLSFLSVRQCFVSRRGSFGVKDQTSNGGGGSCE